MLTRAEASESCIPNSKTETTNRRFTVVSGATSGETMPETSEKAPNNHPGVQSRICLPTPHEGATFHTRVTPVPRML